MKILFFTDIHHDLEILERAIKKGVDCDLFVCCGDLSLYGQGLKETLQILKKSKKTLLVIHGNHDDEDELKTLCDNEQIIFMHKKIKAFDDVVFCAYGGGGFSFTDDQFDAWVSTAKERLQKIRDNKKVVLFIHPPPYGTKLDDLPIFGHRGSMSGRNAIKTLKPDLFASGHFHESFYEEDMLGKTKLINPGDEGIIIEL